MLFHILRKIISECAEELKTNAAYQGEWDDGLLIKLEEYKDGYIN